MSYIKEKYSIMFSTNNHLFLKVETKQMNMNVQLTYASNFNNLEFYVNMKNYIKCDA